MKKKTNILGERRYFVTLHSEAVLQECAAAGFQRGTSWCGSDGVN